ncbi:MAG: AAA family ATPase [Elusimicrobia bacterium CG1_02_37_114]|nr:MAG: AAA family ATPase [Elusimicrobia bacterium CG1_02_37_114]PIV52379.1 MAG: AAA family ATPase [Elusimicrobia bacterium CG02_land_8_20_14_3_00_37_13]PIZ12407.1 MAG: AAA family ATPase [Elusimicrobia bacterium CG_4_10_14_0_8_um_filter_37_32]
MFKRNTVHIILERLKEKRRHIQVITGPRQCGKTTIAKQIMDTVKIPCHYVSADEPILKERTWIEQQWETARWTLGKHPKTSLLILDEIHKIHGWSESVKRLWDEDTLKGNRLHVVLLGSSPLLIHKGLTESLAGRFEIIHVTHWSFDEMQKAFGWDVDEYIYYGGYPGSATLINNHIRWANYIKDSLIETTISKDIFHMTRIDKPILLRRVFELGCLYSGQVLSYQKMLGQLQDAGNTVTLAHYLKLLESAGLIAGLAKYAGQKVRQRGSSPKFQVMNTALITAQQSSSFSDAKKNGEFWGHLVESSVGATILNKIKGKGIDLFYWAGNNREVDFVICKGKSIIAIEVKSSRKKTNLPGIELFSKEFNVKKKLLVGENGIPIQEFLTVPIERFFD